MFRLIFLLANPPEYKQKGTRLGNHSGTAPEVAKSGNIREPVILLERTYVAVVWLVYADIRSGNKVPFADGSNDVETSGDVSHICRTSDQHPRQIFQASVERR